MPTLVELFAYEVPEYSTPERSPSKTIPCPFCRGWHIVARDTRFVRLTCDTKRPDFAELIDVGPAPRKLLPEFKSGKTISQKSEWWLLQPIELWREVNDISDVVAGHLHATDI